jgi:hypothetical protein
MCSITCCLVSALSSDVYSRGQPCYELVVSWRICMMQLSMLVASKRAAALKLLGLRSDKHHYACKRGPRDLMHRVPSGRPLIFSAPALRDSVSRAPFMLSLTATQLFTRTSTVFSGPCQVGGMPCQGSLLKVGLLFAPPAGDAAAGCDRVARRREWRGGCVRTPLQLARELMTMRGAHIQAARGCTPVYRPLAHFMGCSVRLLHTDPRFALQRFILAPSPFMCSLHSTDASSTSVASVL